MRKPDAIEAMARARLVAEVRARLLPQMSLLTGDTSDAKELCKDALFELDAPGIGDRLPGWAYDIIVMFTKGYAKGHREKRTSFKDRNRILEREVRRLRERRFKPIAARRIISDALQHTPAAMTPDAIKEAIKSADHGRVSKVTIDSLSTCFTFIALAAARYRTTSPSPSPSHRHRWGQRSLKVTDLENGSMRTAIAGRIAVCALTRN